MFAERAWGRLWAAAQLGAALAVGAGAGAHLARDPSQWVSHPALAAPEKQGKSASSPPLMLPRVQRAGRQAAVQAMTPSRAVWQSASPARHSGRRQPFVFSFSSSRASPRISVAAVPPLTGTRTTRYGTDPPPPAAPDRAKWPRSAPPSPLGCCSRPTSPASPVRPWGLVCSLVHHGLMGTMGIMPPDKACP
jgi:hypothetical protein